MKQLLLINFLGYSEVAQLEKWFCHFDLYSRSQGTLIKYLFHTLSFYL